MKEKVVVLSLGGSLIVPDAGLNAVFIKQFQALIRREVKRGRRFIIVVGGGTVARHYQSALRACGNRRAIDLDWVGIRVSRLNAYFMQRVFGSLAYPEVVTEPQKTPRSLLRTYQIVFAGGEKPGQSTDQVAVKLAVRFHAHTVVNLSNIRYIYDKDPKKHALASPYAELSWRALQKIVGSKWTPGANVPFDPRATRFAARHGLTVKFLEGADLKNFSQALHDKPFHGTIVK